jgi:transposase InsO family protein
MKVVHPGLTGEAGCCEASSIDGEARMNIHKNARTTPFSREVMVSRMLTGQPVGAVSTAFGVSERTVYKWLARWRQGGAPALRDRSSAPRRRRHLPAKRIATIEALRRRRMTSPAIAAALGLPVSTVGQVLRRLGLNRLKSLDPPIPVVRYERQKPGELIHIDTKKLGRIDGIGHRISADRTARKRGIGWEHLHVAIDDASRLAYTEMLPDERGATCAGFLTRAAAWFARLGVRIERVMTDNAFAYTHSRAFKASLAILGARHITTKPYRPCTNGKAERFIQTALREWLYARPYLSSNQRSTAMPAWLHWYNHHRPHAGIHAATPARRLNNLLGNDS